MDNLVWMVIFGTALFWGGVVMGILKLAGVDIENILIWGGVTFLAASAMLVFVIYLCKVNEGD